MNQKDQLSAMKLLEEIAELKLETLSRSFKQRKESLIASAAFLEALADLEAIDRTINIIDKTRITELYNASS